MKQFFLALSALSLFTYNGVARAATGFDPNRIVVKVKPHSILPDFKFAKSVRNLFDRVYVVSVDNVVDAEQFYRSQPDVEYAERDFQAQKAAFEKATPAPRFSVEYSGNPSATPLIFNDPRVEDQWTLRDSVEYGISVTQAYQQFPAKGQQVIVAILDTGVEYTHEDLAANMWTNPSEIPGNGLDDDGNGYVDDEHGINTLERDAEGRATSNVMDKQGHGTHVAGIIGATQNNGIGVAGIASNVRLMAIRAVPNDADEKDVDIAEGMIYAAKNGAKIINCSFGKRVNEGGKLIPDTIQYIGEHYGVLVVAAAGNDFQEISDTVKVYPASYQSPNLLVVASTSSTGAMSYFSNYGKKYVHVAAPGSMILSTYLDSDYSFLSGTSMACPTTVGVAAQILSQKPDLNPVQLKNLIMDSVTPAEGLRTKVSTGGRIDLRRALEKSRRI